MSPNSLYNRVVEITAEYLGPPAKRFVNRQITNHLKKEPQDLQDGDLDDLIVWLRVAMNVLTSDTVMVDEYVHSIASLNKLNIS